MEWNAKSPGQWDWEHLFYFNSKATENPRSQPTYWSAKAGGENVGLIYPSGGSGCSGSELVHASSSRSTKSASINSLSNGDSKTSTSIFTFEGSQDDSTGKKELSKEEPVETSLAPDPSSASGEPLLTLKLGKRLYFEDGCAGNDSKKSSSTGLPISSSSNARRKCKSRNQNLEQPSCQVEGCGLDLSSAKDYHRKHRVCESHSKSPKVHVAGSECRFCQQCSRFHGLSEFDDKKRSCRRRLSDHNARRRKPPPEAVQLNPSALSSSPYDGRHLVNPVAYSRNAANLGWQGENSNRLPQTKDFLMRPAKAFNCVTMLSDGSSCLLTPKGTATKSTISGKEDRITLSDPNAAQDFHRALSLLSTNSWATHAMAQHLPLASMEYGHMDQQPVNSSMCFSYSSDCGNSSCFQDFHMLTAPEESNFPCNQLD